MGIKFNPITGQFNITNKTGGGGTAPGTSYNPTNPADWPVVPTNVQNALDELASEIAGISTSQVVDKFTLNGTDVTNKFVTLTATPSVSSNVILLVANAPNMFYGIDFTVSANQLSWNGLALDGVLSSGDNLTVLYTL